MSIERAAPLTPEQKASLLEEAVRRVHAAYPNDITPALLRPALEAEMDQGTTSLVALMKKGRRRALRNASRKARRAKASC